MSSRPGHPSLNVNSSERFSLVGYQKREAALRNGETLLQDALVPVFLTVWISPSAELWWMHLSLARAASNGIPSATRAGLL